MEMAWRARGSWITLNLSFGISLDASACGKIIFCRYNHSRHGKPQNSKMGLDLICAKVSFSDRAICPSNLSCCDYEIWSFWPWRTSCLHQICIQLSSAELIRLKIELIFLL
jgi:hypothetical protein